MKTIKTEEALFDWLFKRLLEAEPIIDATPGLLDAAKDIHSEVRDFGYLARYDRDCWRATFDDILRYVSKPGKARCSERVIDWLAEVYATTATAFDPLEPLPLSRINSIALEVLELGGRYLTFQNIDGFEQIRSTSRCHREFDVRINVESSCVEEESLLTVAGVG